MFLKSFQGNPTPVDATFSQTVPGVVGGAYELVGWSLGGVLLNEILIQLQARGEQAYGTMIDAWSQTIYQRMSPEEYCNYLKKVTAKVLGYDEGIHQLDVFTN